MSTRSAIGYVMPSGRIKAVYCHWDGEPRIKEKELKQYKDKTSVVQLIKKGNMSSLETRSTWLTGGHGYFAEAREPQPLYHKKEVTVGHNVSLESASQREKLLNSGVVGTVSISMSLLQKDGKLSLSEEKTNACL